MLSFCFYQKTKQKNWVKTKQVANFVRSHQLLWTLKEGFVFVCVSVKNFLSLPLFCFFKAIIKLALKLFFFFFFVFFCLLSSLSFFLSSPTLTESLEECRVTIVCFRFRLQRHNFWTSASFFQTTTKKKEKKSEGALFVVDRKKSGKDNVCFN